ncbi:MULTISPECIES: galactose-6-phosphate isomerase subunit LacA [Clostridia]|uniref:galactose-6-phosphate isomerase subunit LacA n=1 Tax=Clostridia TaxID=186801 RepID=UPI000EA33232|nr:MULTISPECIES: galactose-6-phosphate isomerase subunit LacA [Clostridia]NBJ70591.1 galactose-6-phosphate isomerase subunit LacA [Roseburia sp. 1XD42-34]RKI76591.1 galactose-6-phosphate isomerase subunit LacA [Clostridium sp. 1xD42-85]
MKIVIGSDLKGFKLKELIKMHLVQLGYEVKDLTPLKGNNYYDATLKVAEYIQANKEDKGIMIDEYGVGPFMIANKLKGIICANLFDEHSARMTRSHNNTNMVTIGSGIVGDRLAEKIVETFAAANYDGGRHQIRVDMLNKMC